MIDTQAVASGGGRLNLQKLESAGDTGKRTRRHGQCLGHPPGGWVFTQGIAPGPRLGGHGLCDRRSGSVRVLSRAQEPTYRGSYPEEAARGVSALRSSSRQATVMTGRGLGPSSPHPGLS